MSDIDVFRFSAKSCGHMVSPSTEGDHVWIVNQGAGNYAWNPFTNDSQRWECVKKLLENDGTLVFSDVSIPGEIHEWYRGFMETSQVWHSDCPAEEFPARTLADLESRKAST